jgi:hypothetical protein
MSFRPCPQVGPIPACLGVSYLDQPIHSDMSCGPCQKANFERRWMISLEDAEESLYTAVEMSNRSNISWYKEDSDNDLEQDAVAALRASLQALRCDYDLESLDNHSLYPPEGQPPWKLRPVQVLVAGRSPLRDVLFSEVMSVPALSKDFGAQQDHDSPAQDAYSKSVDVVVDVLVKLDIPAAPEGPRSSEESEHVIQSVDRITPRNLPARAERQRKLAHTRHESLEGLFSARLLVRRPDITADMIERVRAARAEMDIEQGIKRASTGRDDFPQTWI